MTFDVNSEAWLGRGGGGGLGRGGGGRVGGRGVNIKDCWSACTEEAFRCKA